ncbi:glycosyl hydrolases family 38 N-terminal domain-containing protein [Dactylonectria estremocensis]|uniref:Alpha-mannosidase n=1 Tax=Dactylonectria estremocensis TaxID=1079267 RepID=A0A9P9FJ75_9HYPO|nr:glycosyl hydrolases family 38 N-terminal domain-containing protein [Dactylonectria estremocensis]
MGGAGELKGHGSYPVLAERPVGVPKTAILKGRIEPFYKPGQYEKVNLLANMYNAKYAGKPHVQLWVWHAPETTRPTFEDATSHEFKETHVGTSFGPSWSTHWFKVVLCIPSDLGDEELVELHWDGHNEGTIWTHDGVPIQGLTGSGERIEWIIPKSFRNGKEHTIYIEMACNGMFGNAPDGKTSIAPPDPNRHFTLSKADIVAVNVPARMLLFDMWQIGDAARELPENSAEQNQALSVAMRIINTFQVNDQESILKCREIAREILGPDVDSHRVYEVGKEPVVFGIGHCHIDSCWLWPWAETKRKVVRSWTNQCDLMERYPESIFACSQAQQFKWLKQNYPAAYERVKSKVKEGQFHPIGGSWVEHDTNMPSGESLVRQFFYGQRFFESEFGSRCRTFWLPDTFGYSSQLPQLCRLAGMDRFMTQKLSWNNINNFPHTTFMWVSPDGSQVICHMPPSETYTAEANFGDIRRSVSQHKTMRVDSSSLLVFGKGDGGGGPTWQHFEKLRRCAGISNTIGGIPKLKLGLTVDDFFDRLSPKIGEFPTWYGELYFELHRGTYTTQANNKYYNRKAEVMLRDIELLATVTSIKHTSYKYPAKDLDDMWESVLLCQFHDCLPGSSIGMCYDDSDEVYAKVFKTGQKLLKELYSVLGMADARSGDVDKLVAINTLPWHRKELIEISGTEVGVACGGGQTIALRSFKIQEDKPAVSVLQESSNIFVLQNDQLRVVVESGCITSLRDLVNDREIVEKGGKANKFVIFDDIPLYWQAWDVEVYHLDTRRPLEYGQTSILEEKAHRVTLVTDIKISKNSSIKSYISLSAALKGQPSQVDCSAEVDWHEDSKFLKVEFPIDIVSTEASYETAFSVTKRPTHYNTSWDMAKFEVCCHKFADLSEHNYGVSILNDSKYGFATAGKVMRLSLLRSPKAPDENADMGSHSIRWAIFPHKGGLSSETVRAAYVLNNPLKVLSGTKATIASLSESPIKLVNTDESKSLILDTIKRGHDDEDISQGLNLRVNKGQSIICRVYESLGGHARGKIETTFDVKRVTKTNILEDELEEIKFEDRKFSIKLRPFEVATFKIQL